MHYVQSVTTFALPIGCIFFFFYCYGDHRDLHSFPTRRSSDLVDDFRRFADEVRERSGGIPIGVKLSAQRIEADRKSTRLNSSHLGISYAVFCLKKKNKKRAKTCASRAPIPRSCWR